MTNELFLDEDKQYLGIALSEHWDIESLQKTLSQCRSLVKLHKISRLLINGSNWLEKTSGIESILMIGESLSQCFDANCKVAIVSSDSKSQNEILENALSLKGIKLLHFKTTKDAKEWLLDQSNFA